MQELIFVLKILMCYPSLQAVSPFQPKGFLIFSGFS